MAEVVTKFIEVVNSEGQLVDKINLPSSVINLKIKPAVVHQVIVAYRANRRASSAHTKTRSEVAGGGRKPWRQKGTGRARHGSIRSPLWRGGGVTFGPRNTRNYSQKINKQLKSQALQMVLADYLRGGKVVACEQFLNSTKTKDFASWLKKANLLTKRLLIILQSKEKTALRGLQNIEGVELIPYESINAYDLLQRPKWFMSIDSLKLILNKFF